MTPAAVASSLRILLDNGAEPLQTNPAPASLLRAGAQVVPFVLRGKELLDLEKWWNSPEPAGVWLFTGPDGAGKTRLMIEWCRRLRDKGEIAGFVPRNRTFPDFTALFQVGALPAALFIDYAETRLELLRPLLMEMAGPSASSRIKLVLLARRQGDWWKELGDNDHATEQLLNRARITGLSPLVPDHRDRVDLFNTAFSTFREQLGPNATQNAPDREELASDLEADHFASPLFVQMAALAALADQPRVEIADLLRETLMHERRYWLRAIADSGLDRPLISAFVRTLDRTVSVSTLWDGVDDAESAKDLVKRCAKFPLDPPQLIDSTVDILKKFYGTGTETGKWLRGMEPDLLGEQLVADALDKDASLLKVAFENAPAEARKNGLLVLTRLAQRAAEDSEWLKEVLTSRLDSLGLMAVQVAQQAGEPMGGVLAEVLQEAKPTQLAERLMNACPKHTVALREVAAASTSIVLEHRRQAWREPTEDQLAELARLANNLGNRLGQLGRHQDALQAANQATEIYKKLAEARPGAFLPDLATSLNDLGTILSQLGRREEALQAANEATEFHKKLAEARPDAFLLDLAMSLNNLGKMLGELGRREDALQAANEATEFYKKLAEARPDAFLPDLAMSLNNLGKMLGELGRHQDALQAANQATEIRRKLAEARPDAFLPDLAMSLDNLGNRLSELGRREEALQAANQSTEIRRKLAEARPDFFLPYLAISLNNLDNRLSQLGRREDALQAANQATEIRRKLAEARPDAFLPYLAMSLNNLGNRFSELGRREEALQVANEATEIYRKLAEARPDAFLPDLAMSLHNLGNRLSELGRREEALERLKDATKIISPFFLRWPGHFTRNTSIYLRGYLQCAEACRQEPDAALVAPIVAKLNSLRSSE